MVLLLVFCETLTVEDKKKIKQTKTAAKEVSKEEKH